MVRANVPSELTAFAAVARAGSFRRAAALLNLRPSTLSHAVSSLEERLGVKVLSRAFYDGYEAVSGAPVDDSAVRYWEVMAHLRSAVIALEQGHRHTSAGQEASLELALMRRMVPELERAVLLATGPDRWRSVHA